MKKILAVLILSLVLHHAQAQELTDYSSPLCSRDEIGLSITPTTTLQTASIQAGALVSIIGSLVKNDLYIVIPFPVPFSLEYDHWFNERIALGVCLNTDIVSCLPLFALGNVSIMPDMKVSLYNGETVRFYSKLAVGYSSAVWCYSKDGKMSFGAKPSMELLSQYLGISATSKSSLLAYMLFPPLGFQLNPFCIDMRTSVNNLVCFCEFGFGTAGWGSLGLKMLF